MNYCRCTLPYHTSSNNSCDNCWLPLEPTDSPTGGAQPFDEDYQFTQRTAHLSIESLAIEAVAAYYHLPKIGKDPVENMRLVSDKYKDLEAAMCALRDAIK